MVPVAISIPSNFQIFLIYIFSYIDQSSSKKDTLYMLFLNSHNSCKYIYLVINLIDVKPNYLNKTVFHLQKQTLFHLQKHKKKEKL